MSCKCEIINIINDNNVIVVSHADGRDGKSAYKQAVEGGYTGTEQEFNCSLSLLADVSEGKRQIADAINTKGGSASADSSFSKLAEDIENLNDSFITYGVTADPKINWLEFICDKNSIVRSYLSKIINTTITLISSSETFANSLNLSEVEFTELTDITGSRTFSECLNLVSVRMNNLTEVSGQYTFYNCKNLKYVEMQKLKSTGLYMFQSSGLKNIVLESLEVLGEFSFMDSRKLEEIIAPNTYSVGRSSYYNCTKIKNLIFGTLTIYSAQAYEQSELRNITIGQDTNISLNFERWTARIVIQEGQSGIDELNSNLRTNLLEKLYDHSEDGQTRTLRLGWLAHVTQENIDYANSKGWTLTT